MDRLRQFLELGRNHYEKLILVLALIGLGSTVWILNVVRQNEAEKTQDYLRGIDRQPNRPLNVEGLARYQAALRLADKPLTLDLGLPHNLFNPVKWLRQPNGELLKVETGGEVGPSRLEYLDSKELRFIVSLERPAGSGYQMGVIQETASHPFLRRKRAVYATLGDTNEFFTLLEVKGEAQAPTELILQLTGAEQPVSVLPDKPYIRVDGFEADLKYPPEGKEWKDQREGAVLPFAGDAYKIIAITADEVRLSAISNGKPYRVPRKRP